MLKYLKYSVTFPSTGREFKNEIDFTSGLTAITGANENGKSLIMEMIRYALFGASALRGVSGDYKTLDLVFAFGVRGQNYRVVRNRKAQLLYREEDVIATGTSMLNSKIPAILGFGLKVFDIACSCNQGDIEALGNMKPAERKRMVDTVIGLDAIEEIEKWTRTEARNFQNTAASLQQSAEALKPVPPEKPDNYIKVGKGESELKKLRGKIAYRNEIQGMLRNEVASPGAAPVKPDTALDLATAQEMSHRQQQLKDRLNGITREYSSIPAVQHDLEQLEAEEEKHKALDKWLALEREYKARGPKPTMTPALISETLLQLNIYDQVNEKQRLLAKGHNECPSCGHTWPIADITGFDSVPDHMDKPEFTRNMLRQQGEYLAAWEGHDLDLPPRPDDPVLSKTDIAFARQSLDKAEIRKQLHKDMLKLQEELGEIPADIYDLMMALARWESEVKVHAAAKKAFDEWKKQEKKLLHELGKYDGLEQKAEEIEGRLQLSRQYDILKKEYQEAEQKYTTLLEQINDTLEQGENYHKAGKALTNLRTRVKQHLVPSLNKVSSVLLSQMTGGQRTQVEIDDEFTVQIDGQALNTLSGSGKSVANLAIRLGLGQVLTGKIFSVFMGDEIDAAMDKDRAGFTSDCLHGLTDMITQVILVTHKEIEADQVVRID